MIHIPNLARVDPFGLKFSCHTCAANKTYVDRHVLYLITSTKQESTSSFLVFSQLLTRLSGRCHLYNISPITTMNTINQEVHSTLPRL